MPTRRRKPGKETTCFASLCFVCSIFTDPTRDLFFFFIVSVFGILKNPMILMSLVSLGLFVGMPKLMENSKFPS